MKRKTSSFYWQLVAVIGLLLWPLAGCRPLSPAHVKTLTIGLPALEQNALIYIAENQGFFKQKGLEVAIQSYSSGVLSLEALAKNEVDLAVAAEFPVVGLLLKQDPILVVASMNKFENDFIITRNDRGINQASDIRGKRIGLSRNTIAEFLLGRFLELNGIDMQEVKLVDVAPDQFVDSIVSGQVDALVAWQPYIHTAEQKSQDLKVWPVQSNQPVYSLLVTREDWLKDHSLEVALFLESLLEAETFLIQEPEKAKTIVQDRLNYSTDYIEKIWPDHEFALTLDSSLIVAMNDEARWLIRSGLSDQPSIPDFYTALYPDGLIAIKPEAVTVGR